MAETCDHCDEPSICVINGKRTCRFHLSITMSDAFAPVQKAIRNTGEDHD